MLSYKVAKADEKIMKVEGEKVRMFFVTFYLEKLPEGLKSNFN